MKAIESPNFNRETRENELARVESTEWDLLIIGGGATGAACARDAALRGFKTLLVEADDFASGTSSGSSKLIHGGIRYLENFEFGLVYEAIQEREKLQKLYAPFVQSIDFVFPTYRGRKPSKWMLGMGLTLYDSFSFFREKHRSLSRKESLQEFPYLEAKGLTGCMVYADSFAEDYRVVVELIKSAVRHQACCLSRMRVSSIDPSGDVMAQDQWGGKSYRLRAKSVLNCSGPFSDSIRKYLELKPTLHLTQGVHFILPAEKLPIQKAFVLSDPENNRILFAIPWNSITYLGTTDTSVKTVEEARAHKDDLDYVLSVANQYFQSELQAQDVIQSWSGVRPLIQPDSDENNSKISREHQLRENPKGIFHVLGGKLTSHRVMAEEAVDAVAKHLGSSATSKTDKAPLQDQAYKTQDSDHLNLTYGQYAKDVREIAKRRPDLKEPLKRQLPHIGAEIKYSIDHEMCLSPLDFLRRRSSLYYESPDTETIQKVCEIFFKESNSDEQEQVRLRQELNRSLDWDQKGYK